MSRKKNRKQKRAEQKPNKPNTLTQANEQERTLVAKAAMLEALRLSGGVVSEAAKEVNINRWTHYSWLDSDPTYGDAVKEITETSLDECEMTVFKLMRTSEHDPTRLAAAKTILQAKGKHRGYGTESRKVEHSGKIETDSKIEVVRVVHFPTNNTDTSAVPLPASWEAGTSIHQPS